MIADTVKRKKEGFEGQKAIVIPRKILASQCENNNITGKLYITDIGYYPKAKFHYRERLHGADQHILIYCTDGKGSVRISKSEYAIKPGDFFIIPKNIAHIYASNDTNPWTIYWIHFKGDVADDIVALGQKQLEGYKGFVHYNDARISLFNNMYDQLERGYGSDNIIYANMCVWHYLTTFIFHDKFNVEDRLSKYDTIDRAIDFMSEKIDQMINLEDIAKTVNLSSSHFSSLFKKKTGFSPIDYFNHLKVQKACQYLLFSDLRVKEIAFKLGVDDQYYFSRLFSKVMGVSPNEYREKKVH
jgi:AraC-like DNA-binding protein